MVIVAVMIVLLINFIAFIFTISFINFIFGKQLHYNEDNDYTGCPLNSTIYGRGARRVPDDGCKCDDEYEWNDNMDKCNIIASKTD